MRVLQVTNGFPPTATAGVEQYTHQLSRGLSTRHDVRIFCRESAPDRADYELLDGRFDGLQVRRVVNDFQHASRIQAFYLDRCIESIFEHTLDEWEPDLIHFQHCIGLSASLLRVAADAGIPHLLTLHDYWFICSRVQLLHRQGHICPGPAGGVNCYDCAPSPDDLLLPLKGTWIYQLLRKRLNEHTKRRILGTLSTAAHRLPRTHRELARSPYIDRDSYMLSLLAQTPLILTPSRFVRDLYVNHGLPQSRIQVMSLGLDLSPWRGETPKQGNPGNGLHVGYLGALLRHKGVDILLRAFRRLQEPGATLAIHGFAMPGDPFISQVRRFVAKDPRAMLMDRYHQEDLPAILRNIDVVVVPSLWHETFSIVAREALLSGTPVVASEVGALPEIVEHGRNGLLVPAGDVDALHGALQRLSVERGLLARLQDGALHSTQQIKSMEDHVDEVEEQYMRLAHESETKRNPTYSHPSK